MEMYEKNGNQCALNNRPIFVSCLVVISLEHIFFYNKF